MQLRLATSLTAEEYVAQRFWEKASLSSCPRHPEGGCGFCRHTPYERAEPPGAKIARARCPLARETFSLLPDCLASRLPSTLVEVEEVVARVEERTGSLAKLGAKLRPSRLEVDRVQGAVRWLRRRSHGVRAALRAIIGLLPDRLAGCPPTLACFRAALGCGPGQVLIALRRLAADHLRDLPPPLGFGPRPTLRRTLRLRLQQEAGPDPPKGAV